MDLIWAGFEDDGEMKYDHGFECLCGWMMDRFWEKKQPSAISFVANKSLGWVEKGPIGPPRFARSREVDPLEEKKRCISRKDDNPDVANFSCFLCVML